MDKLKSEIQRLKSENERLQLLSEKTTEEENNLKWFVEKNSDAISAWSFDIPFDPSIPYSEQQEFVIRNLCIAKCNPVQVEVYGFDSPEQMQGLLIPDVFQDKKTMDYLIF